MTAEPEPTPETVLPSYPYDVLGHPLEKDGTIVKPNHEIIASDRFKVHKGRIFGEGEWSTVYVGKDTALNRPIAIKIFDPSPLARKTMEQQGLTEKDVMRREARALKACANIVPAEYHEDDNGKPFLVSGVYAKFFSGVLADAAQIRQTRLDELEKWKRPAPQVPFATGLFLEEIIRFSRDIVNGLAEFHQIYGRALADLKPDNLAVELDDDKRWRMCNAFGLEKRILINDLGTSTFASVSEQSAAPRDNRGEPYTRAPHLWLNGSHPSKTSDVFSFGSLLYMMFTGRYIFQDELSRMSEQQRTEFMSKLLNKSPGDTYQEKFFELPLEEEYKEIIARIDRLGSGHTDLYKKTIDDKLASAKDMPPEFREFMRRCLLMEYKDGNAMKQAFEDTLKTYNDNEAKKDVRKELMKKARKWFLGGTLGAAAALGIAWLAYLGPKPDYASRTDFETRAQVRPVETSNIQFEAERDYSGHLETFKTQNPNVSEGKSITDKVGAQWLKAENEAGDGLSLRSDMNLRARHYMVTGLSPSQGASMPRDNLLKEMLTSYFSTNQIRPDVVDLEDALTGMVVGTQRMRMAQKAANSTDFTIYSTARDAKGEYILAPADQAFLNRLLYRVSASLPGLVQIKSDSHQSE